MRTSLGRLLGVFAIVCAGCGKSSADGTGSGSIDAGAGAGAGALGGSSGAVGTGGTIPNGGSQSTGGSAGAARGGSSSGGGAGGDDFARCRDNMNFITVSGDLPDDFGASAKLDVGCADAIPGEYPWPVSFTQRPPEAPGMQVESVACTSDGHLKVIVYSNFRTRMGDATSSIAIYVGGAIHRSMSVTVAAAQTPLATWPFPVDLSEGIGGIYEGSFDNSAFTDGGPATVSGRFSVCHVANLSSGM